MVNHSPNRLNKILLLVVLIIVLALTFHHFVLSKQTHIETALLSGQRVDLTLKGDKTVARTRNKTGEMVANTKESEPVSVEVELLLTGLGENPDLIQKALTLPKEIALGLSAHTPTLEYWIDQIKLQDRAFYIELPLHLEHEKESVGGFDIISIATPSEQVERVKELFFRADGRKGAYIILQSGYMPYRDAYHSLFTFLAARKIPIIYAAKDRQEGALLTQYQFEAVDSFIRSDISPSVMYHQLREVAGKNIGAGSKQVMMQASEASVETLERWLEETKKYDNISIVSFANHTEAVGK